MRIQSIARPKYSSVGEVPRYAFHPEVRQREDRIAAACQQSRLILGETAARSRHDNDARTRAALMIEERGDHSIILKLGLKPWANLAAPPALRHPPARHF